MIKSFLIFVVFSLSIYSQSMPLRIVEIIDSVGDDIDDCKLVISWKNSCSEGDISPGKELYKSTHYYKEKHILSKGSKDTLRVPFKYDTNECQTSFFIVKKCVVGKKYKRSEWIRIMTVGRKVVSW